MDFGLKLFCKSRGADAVGFLRPDDTFVVKAGSHISSSTPSALCPVGVLKRLEAEKHNLNGSELLCDLVFTSSSAAASFVMQCSANGYNEWVDQTGIKLGDL